MSKPIVKSFFETTTNTWSFVVEDESSKKCAIIDSVMIYKSNSATTSTEFADLIIKHVQERGLTVEWILETHAHADHISAAPYIREKMGGKIAIGSDITIVQSNFKSILNMPDLRTDGSQFDHLFKDGDEFSIGTIKGKILHTPGHTPSCLCYSVGDCVFTGDTIFMPDFGTARCDFPGGSAATLYKSITQKIFSLPDDTRLFVGHDYPPTGRDAQCETTVGKEKAENIHVKLGTSEETFVGLRTTRDEKLTAPNLILPSIQANVNAGRLPEPEPNGVSYFKIPINVLKK
jgi:glyoxylase-like metal-dependent hydrolase (beta-lactamase superfamily II)